MDLTSHTSGLDAVVLSLRPPRPSLGTSTVWPRFPARVRFDVTFTFVAATDFDSEIKQLQATMKTIGAVLDLDGMREEIADLGEQVAVPDLWDDQANAQRVTGRLSLLQGTVDRFVSLEDRIDDLGILVQLAQEEADADSMAEAEAELAKLHKSVEQLEVRTLL